MCKIYYLLLGIIIYLLGSAITYVITKRRVNWVISNKTDIDTIDEDFGVAMFSMLSFIGLILFLLIRLVDIIAKQIDKLFKL